MISVLKVVGLVILLEMLGVHLEPAYMLIFIFLVLGVAFLTGLTSTQSTIKQSQQHLLNPESQEKGNSQPNSEPQLKGAQSSELENYYELLGIGPTSSVERIKERCLELAEKCKPDAHPNNHLMRTRFFKLERAYETLTDPDKRKQYDQQYRNLVQQK